MNSKTLLVFVALVLCIQHSQASRQLLAQVTCADLDPPPSCGTGFTLKGDQSVDNSTTTATQRETCCFVAAASNCTDLTGFCDATTEAVKAGTVSANATWVGAKQQCCEPKFTTETCANLTTAQKPVCSATQYFDETGSLAGIVKSNTTAKSIACCEAIPACSANDCPASEGPWTVGNTSVVPSSNEAAVRTAECCVFPVNATCGNWAAASNVSEAEIFNCSKIAEFPPKANNDAISISNANLTAATAACCDAVYKAADTCASIELNCTAIEGFEVDEDILGNTTLVGVFKVEEEAAKKCCAPKTIPVVEDKNSTNTTVKSSAGTKALSFGVSVLALLAMLLL